MSPTIANFSQYIRTTSLTDGSSISINSDTTTIGILTLTQNTTISNPSGNPVEGQLLLLRIKSASVFTLAYGSSYEGASSLIAPASTTGSNLVDEIEFRYSVVKTKWIVTRTSIVLSSNVSSNLDLIGSTQGSLLYRGASSWNALAPGTSGYTLHSGGSGANPSWAAPEWTTVTKTSDESRTSNTTSSADSQLTFTPPSTGFYQFELFLVITCTATTGGLRGGFLIPTNAQLNWNARNSGNSGLTNGGNTQISSGIIAAANAVATQMVFMTCAAQHIDASGSFTLQWAQNASSANPTTIKSGSILRWRKVT